MSRPFAFADFEYRDDGRDLIVGCFWRRDDQRDERVVIDFRRADGIDQLAGLRDRWSDATWVAYAARAEMHAFLTAGLDIRPMRWLDLFAAARQITETHADFMALRKTDARGGSLLRALRFFGIASRGDAAWKEAMRQRILHERDYDDAQWAEIVDYCWSDVEALPPLLDAVRTYHAKTGLTVEQVDAIAVYQAQYLQASATLEHRARGFPIDEPLLQRIFTHRHMVRRALAERCNAHYGAVFVYNPVRDDFSFSFKALRQHVENQPFYTSWETTATGKLRMDEDYLDLFVRKNPHFKLLKETRDLLKQLQNTDLRDLLRNGFIKGENLPFWTRTGRNQPKTTQGFIFNMPSWVRHLVRPKPGHVLIGADYKQQEIRIAAALSGDPALHAILGGGDVYLRMAKMAGAVPPDATEETHAAQRQQYKSVQLGIGYGMGAESLGRQLFLDLHEQGLSYEAAQQRAAAILQWHKNTFRTYWDYINETVNLAKRRGWLRTKDGWTYFADRYSKFTQLQNYPMQANAAVMLREAIKFLAEHDAIELVCSLHDAIYIYCPEEQAIEHENILRRAMTDAAYKVMTDVVDFPIDVKRYSHRTGYTDKRGVATLSHILSLLDRADSRQESDAA